MQRLYSMFPRGGPGVGLVFLRISVLASLHVLGDGAGHWAVVALAGTLGCGFLVGLMTPAASALGIGWMLVASGLGTHRPDFASLALLLQLIALILLGPGAYSLDARLYGRRLIDVEPLD